jgi:hypothetical protein
MAKRFSLSRKTETIELEQENGTIRTVIVTELDGTSRDRFMTNMAGRMRVGPDGKPQGLKNFDGFQSQLLAMSLVDADTGKLIPEVEIRSWPGSLQTELFLIAQEISGLNRGSEEAAKND